MSFLKQSTTALLLAISTLAASATARAQGINVDVGATPGTNPANAYAAGAPQAGWWSWFNSAVIGVPQGLQSLTGAATLVTLTVDAGAGAFTFNNPATALDDEALMDDLFNVGVAGTVSNWTFHNLAPGGYWVYTYAWAPDNATFRTKVHVAGSLEPDQRVGGTWIAAIGQEYVRTFSSHFVVVAAGANLVVTTISDGSPGSVNGFQLIYGGAALCDGELQNYCTAKINSAGCAPTIASAGTPSATAGAGFHITASALLSNKPGILLYSAGGPAATPFGGGVLCLAPAVRRAQSVFSGGVGVCGGHFDADFNAFIAMTPALQTPGLGVCTQYWSRDPGFAAPDNISLTDALHFTICF